MSEFDGRPFVAGSINGVRAFKVDGLGRLTGVTFGSVFKPGENIAEHGAYSTIRHQPARTGCSCGFYAYYDGSNTYSDSTTVTAVIEGYGVCSVGDQGFRAEKARLLALVDPRMRRSRNRPHAWFDRVADWHERNVGLSAVAIILLFILAIVCTASSFSAPPLTLVLLAPALCAWVSAVFVGAATFHSISRQYPSVSPSTKRCPIPPRRARGQGIAMDLVLRNYPGVPVYGSLRKALRCHPVAPPAPSATPSPETHEDFWSMGVTA